MTEFPSNLPKHIIQSL